MKPSIFQIGIISLFSIVLLFPSQAFSEKINESEDGNLKAKLKEKYIELKSKAQDNDTIPIIIGLNTAYNVEGKLLDSKIKDQKNKIRQDQDSLIGFLSGYKVDKIHKFKHISAISMNVDKKSLERLESSPLVGMISEDVLFEPFLAQSVPLVGAPAAWSSGATGLGQAVAILDTGVDKTHPMLSGKVIEVAEACFSSNGVSPLSFTVCPGGTEDEFGAGTAVPCDPTIVRCDHGTHVAGIATGNDVNYQGVAKDANIIAVQVFSKFTDTDFCDSKNLVAPCVLAYTSDIVKGLDHVMSLSGTYVISSVNLSLGGGKYISEDNCDADPVNFFLKQSAINLRSVGIATVASSGNVNTGGYTNSMGSPACIKSVISVGSTTKSDVVSFFSNSASYLDLLAPGSSITSSILNQNYGVKSGTSMAAPHVAGAWAVLKSGNNAATVDQVLNSLTSTGVSIPDTRNGSSYIFPRIQVDDALNDLVLAPWYDANWQLRKQITINSAQVASTLTDFPVLISVTDTDLSAAQLNGDDILFTAGDGITKLSHEIESWDDASGKLAAWVKVPSLSSVSDTDIYIYYSNALASNQQAVLGETWRSEYKAVYHLQDELNIKDSTANGNDCTNDGSTNVVGTIADAQEFDGIDDVLRCGSDVSIDDVWNNGGTISVWLEADTRGENNLGRIFQKYVNIVYPGGESAGATRFVFQTQFDGDFGLWLMNNFPITFNDWNLFHLTYNSDSAVNDPAFWVNGNSEPVTELITPSGAYLGDSSNNLNIGNTGGTARTWDGKIDEFRIYDGTLSSGWITTEHNNQNNPSAFYTVGTQEIQ